MFEKEKSIAKTLADALEALPDGKKEYLLGYAEGVNAMIGKRSADKPPEDFDQNSA